MKRSHIAAVFKKDGLELLRDKRTWFVNIVMPVLLYPVLALVGIQIFQLTQPGPDDIPHIGIYNCPDVLQEYLSFGETPQSKNTEAKKIDKKKQLILNTISIGQSKSLKTYLSSIKDENKRAGTATANNALPSPELTSALTKLRELNYSAALICTQDDNAPQNWTIHVIADNAHRDYLLSSGAIAQAVKRFRAALLKDRIETFRLSETFVTPAIQQTHSLASKSESIKTHLLSGFLPVLLVLMAISGAYHPALDLIAGERERGTLETLLSWPSDRQSIFFGKLLVVVCAALIMVVLNLLSLGITAGIATSQISAQMAGKIENLGSLASIGFDALALSFIALFPITIIISACSLAIAGIAKSYKEAQTYISPLLMVFMVPSFMCLMPSIRPNMLLDLIPLIGPLVALKSCLQGADMAFVHLAVASASSIGFAVLIVNASIKLLNSEQFLFSGLKNAGWGRFRRWGTSPDTPDGIEVTVLFAVCIGLFMFVGGIFAGMNPAAMVAGPLIAAIALPTLVAIWLGNFDPIESLFLRKGTVRIWVCTLCLVPVLLVVSGSLGLLQQPFAPENMAEEAQIKQIIDLLLDMGGLPLLILCIAVAPGICEELLCRGALLSGFKKSLGSRYAIWMSAFLFASLHMSPWRFMPQFILGVFLAIITIRSRSIFPAMFIHIGYNGLIACGAWYASTNPQLASGGLMDPSASPPEPIYIVVALLIASTIACALITIMSNGNANRNNTGEQAKLE